MKWKTLQMPRGIEIDSSVSNSRYGKFIIEPLERGFGMTIGNSLRRVLLSSLQGAAITSVKIDGVLHEFTTIPGVLEDVTEIILNLKQTRYKLYADYQSRARFKINGPAEVLAGDLEHGPEVEVLNPDQHICTVNKEGSLHMEVEITAGRGYLSGEVAVEEDRPIGEITIDAHFSPVKKVNFFVENTRIGQRVDYDLLTVEVWTDGSILPQDAVAYSAKILQEHFALFVQFQEPIETDKDEVVDVDMARIRDMLLKNVEELELSVRSANCLRAANIRSIGELVRKPEAEMLKYRNFGRKSLKEISDLLTEMGLGFGMDVTPYLGPQAPLPPPPAEIMGGDDEEYDDDDDDLDEEDDDLEDEDIKEVVKIDNDEDTAPVGNGSDDEDEAEPTDEDDKN
ncbi:MAG: DNA-directed RNA polymerase subunit alpha [Candidatus Eisenbacteria bacterium]|nr:DNA-directed RNA polymerase subunit alpha [Candidatus Eisenbacteria bacterium]